MMPTQIESGSLLPFAFGNPKDTPRNTLL
jgi:hypothetical protein